MTVSAMITTRNRAADLAVTLAALHALDPAPAEIIVTLDGCTDESAALLRERFPAVRTIVNDPARGSIASRDRMMRQAQSELILSLDDDSYPLETDFLRRVAALFADVPQLAVLTFPQRSDEFPATLTQADFGPDRLVASYPSSGVVLRRAAYLASNGYNLAFFHAYEEPDYALQCVAAGLQVRLHTALIVRHHYSPRNRNEIRIHHLHARNEQWSVLQRCPAPWWPGVMLQRLVGQFLYACRRGPAWVVREPQWWWATVRGIPAAWRARRPVTWAGYRRWLELRRTPEVITASA